ncbi:MAG: CDGSH iron-sulfur domain-containing protein [Pirellulaceae bacterium]|jgi:CDGSH-type Zn-finger protein|nr:CDGSH iron-sulfur domain-containing protein [Pirellulaceae bacterium]
MAADVTIRIRDNGPLLIEGPVRLVDAEGHDFVCDPAKPSIAICRCGQSQNAPFCDGSHKACSFQSCVRAPSGG